MFSEWHILFAAGVYICNNSLSSHVPRQDTYMKKSILSQSDYLYLKTLQNITMNFLKYAWKHIDYLKCLLVPYLCVFYYNIVELGSYGKLKYYDTMTEEGKKYWIFVSAFFSFFKKSLLWLLFFFFLRPFSSSLHDFTDIMWCVTILSKHFNQHLPFCFFCHTTDKIFALKWHTFWLP